MKFLLFLIAFCAIVIAEEYLLPNTTRPIKYELMITTSVPENELGFTGFVEIRINVLEDTHEIFLNSRQQTIITCALLDRSGGNIEVTCKRVNDDVIVIESTELLQSNSRYDVLLSFHGKLQVNSEGFFISNFVTRDNDSDITRQV